MANNAQKIPLQSALNRFAEKKVLSAIQQLGKALPCSVESIDPEFTSCVTVKFELDSDPFTLPSVQVPVFGPEYIRYPLQVGDKGIVLSADARLGGISGLGSGTASLVAPANLTALFFMPIGNANWTAPIDPDKLELYGKAGVILRTPTGTMSITVTQDNIILEGLLTVNPGVPGALWRDPITSVVKVS